jgi:hypothetical protein
MFSWDPQRMPRDCLKIKFDMSLSKAICVSELRFSESRQPFTEGPYLATLEVR